VLAEAICHHVRDRIAAGALGEDALDVLDSIKVTLGESHVAWASYETGLRAP
jgi:hypothetical protein